MSLTEKKSPTLLLNLNTKNLKPEQIRLIKRINTVLHQVLKTQGQEDFFRSSAELLTLAASAINFSQFEKEQDFTREALGYALDTLEENIEHKKLIHYDH